MGEGVQIWHILLKQLVTHSHITVLPCCGACDLNIGNGVLLEA